MPITVHCTPRPEMGQGMGRGPMGFTPISSFPFSCSVYEPLRTSVNGF